MNYIIIKEVNRIIGITEVEKMKRKIVALLMSGVMVISLCSCSMLSPSKFGEKKVAKFFEEELDGDEVDGEDLIEALENHDAKEFKDGEWASLDKKQTKKLYSAGDMETMFSSFKSVESSVAYIYSNPGDTYEAVWVIDLTFSNTEDIDDLFEDTLDQWDEMKKYYPDFENDEDDEYIMAYFSSYASKYYIGLYRSDRNVLLTLVSNDDDTLDDVCEYFDIESPTSLE